MSTESGSVTERFQEMVNNGRFKNVDICWQHFENHLVKRHLFSRIIFHGITGDDLKRVFHRWVDEGPGNLLGPECDGDPDALCFREFEQLPEVIDEVEDFIKYGGKTGPFAQAMQ